MARQQQLAEVAEALLQAYDTREPVAPPRALIGDLDLDDAYRIQRLQEEAVTGAGRRVVGRKIGLTSPAMQRQLGVDNPDFGFVTDDLVFAAGSEVPVGRFIAPRVEPELAFVLGSDLRAGATLADAREAVDTVHPAVEIIDSRVRDWDIRLVDTVADNASCGAVILGSAIDVPLDRLTEVTAGMSVGGAAAGTGTGADVMGDPLAPLAWLAGVLGEQGVALRAGEIVLTGSFCAAAPVVAGESVDVDYGPYGRLSAAFV
ncbi:2-keto-4-pentenoate hydratase [Corynebacterium halotolerans]|uniref:2-keto-4-pentenoate hydratase n=1 Tax=Corynebacterium halotolerans YIM 70093 = DSM 44683 TaxID=1121362 RepID=M1P5P0_9CORY|nr:fumarylacetoacetate hydrolase family protein [Corynebacterium halotolerans]AGF71961.1 2-keto-4-pentenoate hydratase [Corynebacterium halotolerans YIM 70093 = DSM 44683]